ncbi:MAG: hypothetical protein AAFX50_21910 [Acidobacteriota bacterium]
MTLQRLEKKGLVTSWLSEPRAERGGERRRQVRVAAAGRAAVDRSRAAFESPRRGLDAAAGESARVQPDRALGSE